MVLTSRNLVDMIEGLHKVIVLRVAALTFHLPTVVAEVLQRHAGKSPLHSGMHLGHRGKVEYRLVALVTA